MVPAEAEGQSVLIDSHSEEEVPVDQMTVTYDRRSSVVEDRYQRSMGLRGIEAGIAEVELAAAWASKATQRPMDEAAGRPEQGQQAVQRACLR